MKRSDSKPRQTTRHQPNQPATHLHESLTLDEARHISLFAQALDPAPTIPSPPDKQAVLSMFHRLGAIQLDSISVVARSHETVLWSRLGPFDPQLVYELYADGELHEYLAHAAAIIPNDLLPYFRRRMELYRDPESDLHTSWQIDEEVNEFVLAAIREQGPLPSRAFERPSGPRPAPWSWWGDKPAKKALDYLWTSGHLSIVTRENFQRVYELMERRFPTFHQTPLPSVEEQQRELITRALSAMGIGTARWTTDYFRTGGRAHVPLRDTAAMLKVLATEGLAIPVKVEGISEKIWLDPEMVSVLDDIRAKKLVATRTTVLSPFDNLVWYRQRTESLFNFEYRLECYTPAPKRIYGYYTLPILHHGKIVGRLDPSFDRKRRLLTIKSVHLEPGVEATPLLATELVASLWSYCQFLGGTDIAVGTTRPDSIGRLMRSELS